MPRKKIRAIRWLILYGTGSSAIDSIARAVAAALYEFNQAARTSACTCGMLIFNGVWAM